MRIYALAILLSVFWFPVHAGEAIPAWLDDQLPDRGVLQQPGVYPLRDGKILAVGTGKVEGSLRQTRAIHLSLQRAERDATYRIAKHLHPEAFADHKQVSVDVRHVMRVSESPAQSPNQTSSVAIVANAEDISIRPMPDADVILDAKKTVIPKNVLFFLQDPLLQLGGGRIFAFGNGWIAVAVGVTPILGNDSIAERNALKAASLEAGRALAETIFGNNFQTLEEEAESMSEQNGLAAYREWSRKITKECIEGELRRAAEIGYWFTNDDHAAVAMAVSSSPLDSLLTTVSVGDSDEIPDYPDWNVDPDWEFALLDNPRLLRGGAILFPRNGHVYVVGVGTAKLTGNPANDQINAPRVAKMDAQRNIIRYLSGFSSKSNTVEIEEIAVLWDENGLESSSVIDSLQKITEEKVSGTVRGIHDVGSWKSMDGKLLYQVHVVSLE